MFIFQNFGRLQKKPLSSDFTKEPLLHEVILVVLAALFCLCICCCCCCRYWRRGSGRPGSTPSGVSRARSGEWQVIGAGAEDESKESSEGGTWNKKNRKSEKLPPISWKTDIFLPRWQWQQQRQECKGGTLWGLGAKSGAAFGEAGWRWWNMVRYKSVQAPSEMVLFEGKLCWNPLWHNRGNPRIFSVRNWSSFCGEHVISCSGYSNPFDVIRSFSEGDRPVTTAGIVEITAWPVGENDGLEFFFFLGGLWFLPKKSLGVIDTPLMIKQ